MGLFDSLFRSPDVVGIAGEALEFVLEAAEDSHPHEYMAMLRASDASRLGLEESGQVVTGVLVVPGTTSNSVSATVRTNMIPNDRTAVGSVHSHPNGVLRPSDEDRRTFGSGRVHVIVGAPYGRDDWRAFDRQGEPRDLPVLDVDVPDGEDFFHFSQADVDEELRSEDRPPGESDPDRRRGSDRR